MENKMKKGISIVTIVLNGENEIEETILGVLNQNFSNLEYIVIDGGSTDGTMKIIDKYKKNIDKVVSGKDGGIYQAINKGIGLCTHELVGLIHSGDRYEKDVLSTVYKLFKQTDSDVIYGDIIAVERDSQMSIDTILVGNHALLKKRMSTPHPATFIKLAVYKEVRMYNCEYKIAADYDLLLELFCKGHSFHYSNKILATFQQDGISSTNIFLRFKENFVIRKKQLGTLAAYSFAIRTLPFSLFYNIRKKLVTGIIGNENYFKIKQKLREQDNKPEKS